MAEMDGRVDAERRPLLQLQLPDATSILALVDTGFNGELWLTKSDAVVCGVEFDEIDERIGYVAGWRPVRETLGEVRIVWFGMERVVGVVVDLDSEHRTVIADDPVVVVGTALLSPSIVTLDFDKGTLALRKSAAR